MRSVLGYRHYRCRACKSLRSLYGRLAQVERWLWCRMCYAQKLHGLVL